MWNLGCLANRKRWPVSVLCELLDVSASGYLATDEGWLYLTVMLDLFSRQVVGWSIGPRMSKKLVTDALRMAWFRRRPPAGLIVHSDRVQPVLQQGVP